LLIPGFNSSPIPNPIPDPNPNAIPNPKYYRIGIFRIKKSTTSINSLWKNPSGHMTVRIEL